ncbi:sensor histidine kinase [Nitrospirillum pindoramense]|uniref:histidine kinase n=1 Tax=Nitrospirillum amazonense TaxID=28077 RepID=A0A560HC36_9PROT|nr:ATP-binding protein [Nitrospirillum amazonense]TWB43933.1 signal transduction histidine kinase [Nitrospirillum amazonense]
MTRPAPSLQWQLISRVLALTLALTVLGSAALVLLFQNTVDSLRDRSLQGQAADIAHHAAVAADGTVTVRLPPALEDSYRGSRGEFIYVLLDADGRVVVASDGVSAPLVALSPAREARLFQMTKQGRIFYGASQPMSIGGRNYWVQVAQGPSHHNVLEDSLLTAIVNQGGWAIPLFVLLFLGLTAQTIRSGLKPLVQASELAARISPTNLEVRLPLRRMPKEVIPLLQAVNGAIDRLAQGLREQQRFTADAAHELRTPLAVLRANLDRYRGQPWVPGLLVDVDRMTRVVQQLLDVARLEEGAVGAPQSDVDLADLAAEAAASLAPAAIETGRSFDLREQGPNRVAGYPHDIYSALRNLMENALDHTPAGTMVEVDATVPGIVRVRDHGPGVPADQRAHVFSRFWRAPARRTLPGAGLGLSIVAEVMRRHGGRVEIEDAPGGGAVFALIFSHETWA